MNNDFSERYLQHEEDIKKVLNSQKIFDEDLLHDTYIALYEHAQHTQISDFVSTFVAFYKARCKRRETKESHYEACDDAQLLNYDRADESDLDYREAVGRKVDSLIRYYATHPQKGERDHKRSCKILRLYCQGLSETEISDKLKISQPTVHLYLTRIIERLKAIGKRL